MVIGEKVLFDCVAGILTVRTFTMSHFVVDILAVKTICRQHFPLCGEFAIGCFAVIILSAKQF